MAVADSNRFSAAGSAIGYLAQVEYALLIALQRMDSDVSFRLSLETVDDITFDVEGQPRELWQTKHHVDRQGSLGDASPDVWKTLHNWIETSDAHSACFLFTTATARADTAASLLGPSRTSQDVTRARETLDNVARAAGNKSSADYYAKYLSLSDEQRTELLTRISQNEMSPKKPEEIFFRELKVRTARAYYTSKIGIHTEMEYKGNTYLKEFVGYDAT